LRALFLPFFLLLEELLEAFRRLLVITALSVPYREAIALEQLFFLGGENLTMIGGTCMRISYLGLLLVNLTH
jgi:hypothetical protein